MTGSRVKRCFGKGFGRCCRSTVAVHSCSWWCREGCCVYLWIFLGFHLTVRGVCTWHRTKPSFARCLILTKKNLLCSEAKWCLRKVTKVSCGCFYTAVAFGVQPSGSCLWLQQCYTTQIFNLKFIKLLCVKNLLVPTRPRLLELLSRIHLFRTKTTCLQPSC